MKNHSLDVDRASHAEKQDQRKSGSSWGANRHFSDRMTEIMIQLANFTDAGPAFHRKAGQRFTYAGPVTVSAVRR